MILKSFCDLQEEKCNKYLSTHKSLDTKIDIYAADTDFGVLKV